jgi:hypothetical protein
MEGEAVMGAIVLLLLFRRFENKGMRRVQRTTDRGKDRRDFLRERGLKHIGIDTASRLDATSIAPAIIERAHDTP